jgi:hypothetical protein
MDRDIREQKISTWQRLFKISNSLAGLDPVPFTGDQPLDVFRGSSRRSATCRGCGSAHKLDKRIVNILVKFTARG